MEATTLTISRDLDSELRRLYPADLTTSSSLNGLGLNAIW